MADRPDPAAIIAQCFTEADGYHLHKYLCADGVHVDHDFHSWDPQDTLPIPPTVTLYRTDAQVWPDAELMAGTDEIRTVRARHSFPTVAEAIEAAMPGAAVPAIECRLSAAQG